MRTPVLLSLCAIWLTDPGNTSFGDPYELHATAPATSTPDTIMTHHARGTFAVQLAPQPADGYGDAVTLGRMTIDKQFSGDLVATSKGQMLTGMGSEKGSAGYVAIERVTGTLLGRRGSFILQHTGSMARGAQSLSITIVPDSGTDELVGIAGTFHLTIEGKEHRYDLEYTLPPAP
jgi:hypothetical protein